MRGVQWSFQKDMGVGSLGRRASADYHTLRLFKVERSLKLIFLDLHIVHPLRYNNLSFVFAALKSDPSEPKMSTS